MSTITATNGATTAAAATTNQTAATSGGTLDYNSFLELLVAQLKNQDPTNPADPTAYVSQLASFSSVEQLVNANSKLDAMLTQSEFSQAAAVIGRTVTAADGSISGQIASVQITSQGLTATLTDGQSIILSDGVSIS
jgi:flagellar basal-body rod modification protein FlgD